MTFKLLNLFMYVHAISLEAYVVWQKAFTYIFETQTHIKTKPTKDVYIKHLFSAFLQIFVCFSVFENIFEWT